MSEHSRHLLKLMADDNARLRAALREIVEVGIKQPPPSVKVLVALAVEALKGEASMSDSDDALIESLRDLGTLCTHDICEQAAARLAELREVVEHQAATIERMLDETVEWECAIAAAEAHESKRGDALREMANKPLDSEPSATDLLLWFRHRALAALAAPTEADVICDLLNRADAKADAPKEPRDRYDEKRSPPRKT